MVIKEIIKSPVALRKYFGMLIGFLILLIFLNYYGFEKIILHCFSDNSVTYSGPFKSFFENMISIAAVTLLGASFYWWITPTGISEGDVNVIYSHDIKSTLKNLVHDTEYFFYLGHTARWNRKTSFPEIRNSAENKRTTKRIEAVILDPRDLKACKFYVEQDFSNREKGSVVNSVKDLQIELITTMFKCIELNHSKFVECHIYLTKNVSISRFDISGKGILLSKPYKGDPALLFPADTFFYNSYKEEYRVAKNQADEFVFENGEFNVSKESVKKLLKKLDPNEEFFDESIADRVLETLTKMQSPY